MSDEPVVRICQVQHVFGAGEAQKQVLYNINLEVMPGEIVIMTGPSGSGKTTQGHLVFGCGVAQQEENELRVLSYVGPCFPGTLHMSQTPFSREATMIAQRHPH